MDVCIRRSAGCRTTGLGCPDQQTMYQHQCSERGGEREPPIQIVQESSGGFPAVKVRRNSGCGDAHAVGQDHDRDSFQRIIGFDLRQNLAAVQHGQVEVQQDEAGAWGVGEEALTAKAWRLGMARY